MHVVRNGEKSLGSGIEVVPYQPANWYSEIGAQKKLFQLKNKGLPNFYNWRFVTLTVDPLKFKSAQSAYEYIKPRLRFFIRDLKKDLEWDLLESGEALKLDWFAYCWKLEFQENGMPHWHMLINYKKPIDAKMLAHKWGYGRIDIQRCTDKEFPYTFKYCSKNIEGLPQWFLKYNRPRLFQSSGIFPKKSNDPDWSVSEENEEEAETNSSSPETLGQRLKRYQQMLQFKKAGKYFQLFDAKVNWAESFKLLIRFPQVEFINPFKLIVPSAILTSLTI